MGDVLNLVLGASAGGAVMQALPRARIASLLDVFTEHAVFPLKPGVTTLEWLEARQHFWRELSSVSVDESSRKLLHDFAESLASAAEFDQLIVWTAGALDESLFACWIAATLAASLRPRLALAVPPRELVSARFPALASFKPEQLSARQISPWEETQVDAAIRAWELFTAGDPRNFFDHVEGHRTDLVIGPLHALRGRYPDAVRGLDSLEARLLERLDEHDERTARTVANVLVDYWNSCPDDVGDLTIMNRLLDLACEEQPARLLSCTGGREIRNSEFRLTRAGEAVLAGEVNRLDLIGIDRWIGGVHLNSESGEVWVRDGDEWRLRAV